MIRGAEIYRRIDAQSRSPLELVVMMYDGALRFVGEARDAAARNDLRARAQAVSRTLAILTELQNTLQMEDGGEIARELDRLYTYLIGRLVDVTTKRDVTALDDVHRVLVTLREAWSQISVPAGAHP